MEKYSHKREFSVKYSDVDYKDELSASALLSFVQEVACSSADELGFGYEDLKPHDYGFLVVGTYCRLLRPVCLNEIIAVETWPLPPRHVIFERDYAVYDEKGNACATLASRWCLVHLQSMKLLTATALEGHATCPYRNEKAVEVPSWKISPIGDEGKEVYSLTVRASLCDHYLHANNAKYADLFFDCFTMQELSARRVKSFQISYARQAKEGTKLTFYRKDCENGAVLLEARDEIGVTTQFQVVFEEAV
ncbi:MAG: hypothetical protein J6C93_04610 [Clostridia bacterium]|nr:hypothetical protein [Clostridia bacterium]